MKNILLFGGTFDPVHLGHITPVIAAAKHICADELIYIPCHLPPHKTRNITDNHHRLAMLNLALNKETHPALSISINDYELSSTETSYSHRTICHFKNQYPQYQLHFVIGMDSLIQFTTWFRWQDILTMSKLVVLARPGYQKQNIPTQLTPYLEKQIIIIELTKVDISSSQIRQNIKDNSSTHSLPKEVEEYIQTHGLYQ